jgi:hypothetical protein
MNRLRNRPRRLQPPFATVKPLDANGNSPPVAGLQANSGGREESVCEPADEDCSCRQCGGELDGTERRYLIDGEAVWLHPECHGYRLREKAGPPW